MSTSGHYATSLSDEQWHVVQLMLPEPKWQPGSSVRAKGSRLNRTAGKWNARFRGFAMIVVTVGIMKH